MTAILGISAFYHDAAAALVVDGEIVAAAQEERFTRKKHDDSFPAHAIEYCLSEAGLQADDLDFVGFYDKPLQKFDRLLETYLSFAPRGIGQFFAAMPLWLRKKLHMPREIRNGLGKAYDKRVIFARHHESHAASAFFPSPFESAAILTFDGVGEWSTASSGTGRGNRVALDRELRFPHSLGLLYSAFTYYCGFTVNSGEYKLMGLAPYGEARYVDPILDKLIDLKDDGSLRMDMRYFEYCHGARMISKEFEKLFGGPPRRPADRLTQRDMDLAASVQKVTEEVVLRSVRDLHARTGEKNLCLAGGVGLNCVANGRVFREGPFERIWVQPAAGDAGGALGVALLIWHQLLDSPRTAEPSDSQRGSLLGPLFSDEQIDAFLSGTGAKYERVEQDEVLCERIADEIAAGRVVGWFQGRMEFGPRALGSRSILGDAREPDMQRIINQKVKFREGFRPFAPAVLRSHVHEWFDVPPETDSPYMILVTPVKAERCLELTDEQRKLEGIDKLRVRRSRIAAVTHVDFSARIQTVDPERHGLYCRVIEAYHRKTGCPVVVNTSFNLGWEPIVCTPAEAYDTFMSSEIDTLCMGHYVVEKRQQPAFVPAQPAAPADIDPVLRELFRSPCCAVGLTPYAGSLHCEACRAAMPVHDGVPSLCVGDAATDRRIAGHGAEGASYRGLSLRALAEAFRKDACVRLLDEAIGYNATVLEVGCGTGGLSNFLGISCRRVIGTDTSSAALEVAERFRREHRLSSVRFAQMNPVCPALRAGAFDVVLLLGRASEDGDAQAAIAALAGLLRPGGHMVLGFRSPRARGLAAIGRALSGRDKADRIGLEEIGRAAPVRSPQEVRRSFEQCGLAFVRALPAAAAQDGVGTGRSEMFAPSPDRARAVTTLSQLRLGLAGSDYLLMVGRKPE